MFESFNLQGQAEVAVRDFVSWAVGAVPNLIAAVLLLVLGLWFARWAGRASTRFVDRRRGVDSTMRAIVGSLVRYAIGIVVLVTVLSQLGIETTSIIAALGAIGLAIGLALQGTLSNIAAGFMLLWLRPFKIGDYIEAGGVAGTVNEVGLFASELKRWDGVYEFVPNAEIWNQRIVNHTRHDTRLVSLAFGIGYGDSIATARDVLLGLATNDPRVLDDPTPAFFVDELGDSAVVVCLRVWTKTEDYWPVTREFRERGKLEIEAAGLSIPFPQMDIYPKSSDGGPLKALPLPGPGATS